MLFHVISRHPPSMCPATLSLGEASEGVYLGTVGRMTDGDWAGQSNVKVHSALVSGPGHTIYLTVEADDTGALNSFLTPLKLVGSSEVIPVTELRAAGL